MRDGTYILKSKIKMNQKLNRPVYLVGSRGAGWNWLLSLIIAFVASHVTVVTLYYVLGNLFLPMGEWDTLDGSEKWIRGIAAILVAVSVMFSTYYLTFRLSDKDFLYLVNLEEGEFIVRCDKKINLSRTDLENFGRGLLDKETNLKLSEIALAFRQSVNEKFDKRFLIVTENKIRLNDLSTDWKYGKSPVFKLRCSTDIVDAINDKFKGYVAMGIFFDSTQSFKGGAIDIDNPDK